MVNFKQVDLTCDVFNWSNLSVQRSLCVKKGKDKKKHLYIDDRPYQDLLGKKTSRCDSSPYQLNRIAEHVRVVLTTVIPADYTDAHLKILENNINGFRKKCDSYNAKIDIKLQSCWWRFLKGMHFASLKKIDTAIFSEKLKDIQQERSSLKKAGSNGELDPLGISLNKKVPRQTKPTDPVDKIVPEVNKLLAKDTLKPETFDDAMLWLSSLNDNHKNLLQTFLNKDDAVKKQFVEFFKNIIPKKDKIKEWDEQMTKFAATKVELLTHNKPLTQDQIKNKYVSIPDVEEYVDNLEKAETASEYLIKLFQTLKEDEALKLYTELNEGLKKINDIDPFAQFDKVILEDGFDLKKPEEKESEVHDIDMTSMYPPGNWLDKGASVWGVDYLENNFISQLLYTGSVKLKQKKYFPQYHIANMKMDLSMFNPIIGHILPKNYASQPYAKTGLEPLYVLYYLAGVATVSQLLENHVYNTQIFKDRLEKYVSSNIPTLINLKILEVNPDVKS